MENTKKKANPDYSASAKDLSKPLATVSAYKVWQEAKSILEKAELEIEAKIPTELINARDLARENLERVYKELKETIANNGGFQDIEAGQYALQQKKVSKSYDAVEFGKRFPQYKEAVVIPSVNVKALEGLFKGGLIKEDEPGMLECTNEKIDYVTIIR